jgi:hypothetical protein
MDDEYEDNEYWGILPPEKKYQPFFPELTDCLNRLPQMLDECGHIKHTLNKAIKKIRQAKRLLDQIEK